METIATYLVDFKSGTSSFFSDLKRVQNVSFDTAKQAERSFKIIGGAAAGMIGAATAAVAAMTSRGIETADQMGKLAQRTGLTVEQFSALSYAAKLADVDTGTLSGAMVVLSQNLQKASLATQEGRAAHSALATLFKGSIPEFESTQDALEVIADRLAVLPNSYERVALASQIFGRSGAQLIPLLAQGSAGLRDAAKEARELGVILDQQTAKAAEKFNDNLTKLKSAADGVSLSLARAFLPALDDLSEFSVRMTKALNVTTLMDEAIRKQTGLRDLRENITHDSEEFKKFFGDFAKQAQVPTEAGQKTIASLQQELALVKMTGVEAARAKALWKASADGVNESERALIGTLAARLALQTQLQRLATEAMPQGRGGFTGVLENMPAPEFAFTVPEIDSEVFGRMATVQDELKKQADVLNAELRPAWEKYGEAIDGVNLLEQEGLVNAAQAEQVRRRMAEDFGLIHDKVSQLRPAIIRVGEDFAQQMSRAIVHAEGFRDAIGNIIQQLADMLLQVTVMRPAMAALFGKESGGSGGGILGTIFGSIASIFTGGIAGIPGGAGYTGGTSFGLPILPGTHGIPALAGGGDFSGGMPILVGERGPEILTPRNSGSIIPNRVAFGSSEGVVINITNQVDARGAAPGSEAAIRRALKESEDRTVARTLAVVRERRRRSA